MVAQFIHAHSIFLTCIYATYKPLLPLYPLLYSLHINVPDLQSIIRQVHLANTITHLSLVLFLPLRLTKGYKLDL